MKTKSFLIGLLVIAAGLTVPGHGEPNKRRCAAIAIGYEISGGSKPDGYGGYEYVQTGLAVSWVDRSSNAPAIGLGGSMAEAVAQCLEDGMTIIYDKDGRIMLVK